MLTTRQVLDRLAETIISLKEQTEPNPAYKVVDHGHGFGVYKTKDDGTVRFVESRFTHPIGRLTHPIGRPRPVGIVATFYKWLPDAEEHANALVDKLNKKGELYT